MLIEKWVSNLDEKHSKMDAKIWMNSLDLIYPPRN